MEGGRRDREVSAVRKWRDGGTEIGVSGGKRDCRGGEAEEGEIESD